MRRARPRPVRHLRLGDRRDIQAGDRRREAGRLKLGPSVPGQPVAHRRGNRRARTTSSSPRAGRAPARGRRGRSRPRAADPWHRSDRRLEATRARPHPRRRGFPAARRTETRRFGARSIWLTETTIESSPLAVHRRDQAANQPRSRPVGRPPARARTARRPRPGHRRMVFRSASVDGGGASADRISSRASPSIRSSAETAACVSPSRVPRQEGGATSRARPRTDSRQLVDDRQAQLGLDVSPGSRALASTPGDCSPVDRRFRRASFSPRRSERRSVRQTRARASGEPSAVGHG